MKTYLNIFLKWFEKQSFQTNPTENEGTKSDIQSRIKNILFEDDETMKIWISDNTESIPVKIEYYGQYGTMILALSKYTKYE